MSSLEMATRGLAKAFPAHLLDIRSRQAIRQECLSSGCSRCAEGEFLTILGESGSGKTTLLRIIAGFETASAGEVWMGKSGWIASLRIDAG